MTSRRSFFKLTGALTLGLFMGRGAGAKLVHSMPLNQAIPGGTLAPGSIPKYATPLLIPPVMPKAGTVKRRGGKNVDYYEISMRQLQQQILPAGLPSTTVWGYGAIAADKKRGQSRLLHNAPSLTIEAKVSTPVRIKWINELVDANGNYLPHLLPIDPTLHWANPPGGTTGRDTRPVFTSTPGRYTGPVPMVTHVHGAVGVGDESDGYAEAWYLPQAGNNPADYATTGTWYDFFAGKAAAAQGAAWTPGSATFEYPNTQRASTIWYHDHALGMTRSNVYAGPAGFYIIRGGPAGDNAVLDSRIGLAAVLPGPAPKENDPFPPNKTYYEIPLAIQDRSFNAADGSLFYPDTRAFFDGIAAPYIPDSDVSPIWNPEFFGNCMMVNGNTWPFLNVEQRRYRFRILNGCNARALILDFSGIPGVQVWMIGNEGGFLPAPVDVTATLGNQLQMVNAERADVIIDFSLVPVGNYVLGNVGPDAPFGGTPIDPAEIADPQSTGQIMQFRVGPALAPDPTTPPQFLVLPLIAPMPPTTVTRKLALLEKMSMSPMAMGAPVEALLGRVDANGNVVTNPGMMHPGDMWSDPVTENPSIGATEVWEFYNFTADAHPMHIHEVQFRVVNREFLAPDLVTGEVAQPVQLTGVVQPPAPWEGGLKDTVAAYPGMVTRVIATFANPGQFVWHCHIVEHEDNEMMRPMRIGPEQPGQPMPHPHMPM
jgi:FtsP/CotA-like multicopper oxidase with cupredoxin domain